LGRSLSSAFSNFRFLNAGKPETHLLSTETGSIAATMALTVNHRTSGGCGMVSGSGVRPRAVKCSLLLPALYLMGLRKVSSVVFYWLTKRSSDACGSTSAASSLWMCFMVQTPSIRMKM
jgi:hypothetical protein